ncbi:hypothetical protein JP34_10340 [Gallibacterium anatis]|uniref:DUF488 domain-containing protein n=1 Tax=Gallibacterium anatis TaxID=750 RepID=UPI000531DD8C|nr:DUF488 domain-containing protein [Gallibacterium anatis]KGQ31723.1 hypothetical protein JP34_10340 [Gallibacterium anatis]
MYTLEIKRIYQPIDQNDGFRILVDRLWPRGIKKIDAEIDLWAKEITPSPQLRKWFNHEADKFEQFKQSYLIELNNNPYGLEFVSLCKQQLLQQNVTLLYAAKDPQYNHALVLKQWLLPQLNEN